MESDQILRDDPAGFPSEETVVPNPNVPRRAVLRRAGRGRPVGILALVDHIGRETFCMQSPQIGENADKSSARSFLFVPLLQNLGLGMIDRY